jgi:hypothetical protein
MQLSRLAISAACVLSVILGLASCGSKWVPAALRKGPQPARAVSTVTFDPWHVIPFYDSRSSSTYDIIDGHIMVSCKNRPTLPIMDPNYFDDEQRDLTDYSSKRRLRSTQPS